MSINQFPGLSLRPARYEDAPAIAAINAEYEQAHMGYSESTPNDVLELWEGEQTDLANDTLLLTTAEGECIGYTGVSVSERGVMLDAHTNIRLAYEHDPSLYPMLFSFADTHAQHLLDTHPAARRVCYAYSLTPHLRQQLEAHGFHLVSSDYRMRIILDAPPPLPHPLEGVSIRHFLPGQEEHAVYEVIAEAFPDIDGKPYRPFDEWYERVFEKSPSFAPELLSVAVADGQIVGTILCRTYPEEGTGYIWQVAVRRAWRRRGIALNLLYAAFNDYYQRGMRDISLSVAIQNQTSALDVYRKAGMEVHFQIDYLEKDYE